jgi:hypothetical protein
LIGHSDLSLSVSSCEKANLSENTLTGVRSDRPVVTEHRSLREEADILPLTLATDCYLSRYIHHGIDTIIDRHAHGKERINILPQGEGTVVLEGGGVKGAVPNTSEIWGVPSTTTEESERAREGQ